MHRVRRVHTPLMPNATTYRDGTLTADTYLDDDGLYAVTVTTRAGKRSNLRVALDADGTCTRVAYFARTRWNGADLAKLSRTQRVAVAAANAHRVTLNPVAEIARLAR